MIFSVWRLFKNLFEIGDGNFMKNNTRCFLLFKNLSLLLLVLGSLLLSGNIKQAFTETSDDTETLQSLLYPTKEQVKTTRALVKKLKRYHYLEEPFDDTFSEKVYDNYIKMLDPARTHFLEADIKEFSKYRHSFDEDLKDGNLKPAFFIYSQYHQRRKQRLEYTLELLDKGTDSLDFQKEEYLELDRENLPWRDCR